MSFAHVECTSKAESLLKVTCTFTGITSCESNIASYLQSMDAVYKQNKKFRLLYDARKIKELIPYKYISQQAKFMRDRDAETTVLIDRCAIVIKSETIRFLLKTLFKLKKPACPLYIFTDMKDACTYLKTGIVP